MRGQTGRVHTMRTDSGSGSEVGIPWGGPLSLILTRRRTPRRARVAWGAAAGVAATIVLLMLGIPGSIADTFVLMGLDPDRAQLAMALVVAALAAVAAALAAGAVLPAVGIAAITTGGLFGPTFAQETQLALVPQASQGPFDPTGWLISVTSLTAVAVSIGWAAGTLACAVRVEILAIALEVRPALRARRWADRGWRRAIRLIVSLVVVTGAFSVLGDMLNYAPDTLLRGGGQPGVGLVDSSGANRSPTGALDLTSAAPSASLTDAPSSPPSGSPGVRSLLRGPVPGSLVTSSAWSPSRPWAAWVPTGSGTTQILHLAAPWTGANRATARVDIYLPPGYDLGARRYPVTYEVPWSIVGWQRSAQVTYQLDALIERGAIPAQIVVFVEESSGPYPFSQCADSADARAWWDRYLTQTVVPTVDKTWRTIASREARSLFGFSEGGYCAAMLLARHPDLFAQAAAISGYYDAAPRSSETAAAGLVFRNDPTLLPAWSPSALMRSMPADRRAHLFVALAAKPTEPFYGPYYTGFGNELVELGTPCALLPDTVGHSWVEARTAFGQLLELVASRLAETGILTQ